MSMATARGLGRLSRPRTGLVVSPPDVLLCWFSLSQGPWVLDTVLFVTPYHKPHGFPPKRL